MRFVGRQDCFRWLDAELSKVRSSRGRFVAVRGRRQVGKSRLLTEWLRRRDVPHLYYQALDKPVAQELESFANAVARSSLRTIPPLAAGGTVWPSWEAAFDALAVEARSGTVVVVIDELPYLIKNDPGFEGTLQAAWDHKLQHSEVLLIVVGSDLTLMEALTTYGRPLYQRVDVQKQIHPLNVAELADLLELPATEAFDNYLVTGGFPRVVAARAEHRSRREFLEAACEDEAHPLVFTGQQILAAEFPPHLGARAVLEAIGHGESTWGKILARSATNQQTLADSLRLLRDKGVVAAEDPLCARRVGRRTRYHVADPYLRFWLRFLTDHVADIARGRGDLVVAHINGAWQDYAGVAVEPLVRQSIEKLLPDPRFGAARYVGSYWTRDHSVQVDLIGTAHVQKRQRVELVGSIKWRDRKQFGAGDAAELNALAIAVPGHESTSRRVGVSRTGFRSAVDLDVRLIPDDLLEAWK